MKRFADPSRCPDCGAAITPGAASCGSCRLSLQGMTAQRLFATLSQADLLLAELRAASAPAAAAAAAGAVVPPPRAWAPPPSPGGPAPAPARRLSAVSVPRILLTLGAGCLLVAALVFLAVAWSVLGVGGRTAVLVGFTAMAGALTAWMARRGLRGAGEALALVGYGLLTLDVVGADHAGWFGDLATTGLLALLGVVLGATGAAGALWGRRTRITGLVAGELVAAIGVGLFVLAVDVGDWAPLSASLVIGTLVAGGATATLHRTRLFVATSGSGAVTVISWLALLVYALDRVGNHDATWRLLWAEGHVLPLLAAAAIVAAPALVGRFPFVARVAAAAAGQTLVVYAALAPAAHFGPTNATLVVLAVLVVASTAAWLLPRPWGLANLLTQLLAGLAVFAAGFSLGIRSLARLVETVDSVWAGRAADLLPPTPHGDIVPAGWLLPICVVVLLGACSSVAVASGAGDRVTSSLADLRTATAVIVVSLTATVALYPVPVWVPMGMLLATGAGFAAWWLATQRPATLALSSGFTAAGLLLSLHSDRMTAVALLVVLVLAAVAHLRALGDEVAGVAGAALTAALAGSVWTWGTILDADGVWASLTGLLVVGAVSLVAPYAPRGWWCCGDPADARLGIELGAAATALPLTLAGVVAAPSDAQAEWTAVYLTIAGVVVVLMSLLRSDRRRLGWAGGLLLATASWFRLWDLGVSAPEAYTLPSAAALLVVGVVHLRRNAESSTMTALAPGLSLALVPSLLWALADPTGVRPLLLGLGALAMVLAGVGLRWTAPIVVGAIVGGLLVLRLAAPYVTDAVPRWVLIGAAGALLVALGATWERRLAEARQLVGYVRALR